MKLIIIGYGLDLSLLFVEQYVPRDFTFLPAAFLQKLLTTFLSSTFGGRNWPHGPVKVAELHCEASFLFIEAISLGIQYEGYLTKCSEQVGYFDNVQKLLWDSKELLV